MDVPNLTRDDARVRADLLHVDAYDITLDVTAPDRSPAERTFRSRTEIHFTASQPGASTFVDLLAETIHEATLNGAPVDTSAYEPVDGLVLVDLAEENVLVVDAEMRFTNTGEGLHRFQDPVDGEVYLYSQFETADAKRVYACFDQPDLKATFTVRATVPSHWEAVSNGAEESATATGSGAKTVQFATTARMSPYITAFVAGPYAVWRDEHEGIPLGIYARRSVAEHVDVDDLFLLTKQGFDFYHANFGLRYAFGKYDQLFVPEYNAGAMENAGCVTFNEGAYIFRSKVTQARYERRAETILHEMAHMWFGDLVTMRWWDDLWLNESFATWAATLVSAQATRFTDAWTTFANAEKTWAYRQDQLPSTHPIATDAPDVETAEVNFDGITYAKGASVLKQLAAYVGVDNFLAGLRDYFAEHAYGNTTLSDLLGAVEKSSGRDLSSWSKEWLETTGVNTLAADFTVADDGTYASFAIVQEAPTEVATSNVLRSHRLAIGLYDDVDDRLARTHRVELDVTGERTEVTELVGRPHAALVLVNDDDLTYAKLRFDDDSVRVLRGGGLARIGETLPRALIWTAMWNMTRDGVLATRDYVELVASSLDAETDIGLVQMAQRQVARALEVYADPAWAPEGRQRWAARALDGLWSAAPGSDHQLAWAHAFIASASSGSGDLEVLSGLFDGSAPVEGLAVDNDLRWSLVQALVSRGALGESDIAAELANDNTAAGARAAAAARAMIPTPEAKEAAWHAATVDDTLPNDVTRAYIGGFAPWNQAELVAPYAERYFADVATVWSRRTSELAQDVAVGLFPSWSSTTDEHTLALADRFLAGTDLPSSLRRLVSEGRDDLRRALHARGADHD
ncbi:aminopeptidase N [Jatrophihabitans sp. YIM 134969]